jgi:site-specific recombinase
MSNAAETKSNIIKINDKEYNQDSAFDAITRKLIVSHIKVLQQKVANLRFELDQASVAQDAFINKLLASLEEPAVEEKEVG